MQLLTCALLCVGGAGLFSEGYVLGGTAATALGAVLALLTLGKRGR